MTALNEWSGFKYVGDNIDKTIKPRDMQLNNEPTSLHYFNVCAVKDRIDFSHLSSNATIINPEDIKYNVFYPSPEDDSGLLLNFETHVTRILVNYVLEHVYLLR